MMHLDAKNLGKTDLKGLINSRSEQFALWKNERSDWCNSKFDGRCNLLRKSQIQGKDLQRVSNT